MKNRRRIHCNDFKAQVALESIKAIRTVQQIAAELASLVPVGLRAPCTSPSSRSL